jgi:hypothetical protein
VQPPTNGQPAAAPVNNVPVPQPDIGFDLGNQVSQSRLPSLLPTNQDQGFDAFQPLPDFNNGGGGSMDVLQDFDFDSFLHQDGDVGGDSFNFDTNFLDDNNQIGAE